MPNELKPCPFCGGNAEYCGNEEPKFYVWCETPHCMMHIRYEFGVISWNTRHIEDALCAENVRLRNQLAAAAELIAAWDRAATRLVQKYPFAATIVRSEMGEVAQKLSQWEAVLSDESTNETNQRR